MKTVNSLSGGKTSSYVAANYPSDYDVFSLVRIEDERCKFKDEKIRLLVEDKIQAPFIGTAEEDEIVYTMLDLEQFTGRPITWLTGETFEQVIKNHGGYLPNKMARYCTTDMKTIPIFKWVWNEVKEPVIMRFGYRANEKNRARRMMDRTVNGLTQVKASFTKNANGTNHWETRDYCKPEFPLIGDNIYKDGIEEFWNDKDVRFAYLNNCVGCHWRSPLLLKHMSNKQPDKMQWFARQERESDKNAKWRSDVVYDDLIKWKTQLQLFDTDFNECDSGYCGL